MKKMFLITLFFSALLVGCGDSDMANNNVNNTVGRRNPSAASNYYPVYDEESVIDYKAYQSDTHRDNRSDNRTTRTPESVGSDYNYLYYPIDNSGSTYRNYSNRDGDHYDFVAGLGFRNVVNPNGQTYHNRYRLNETSAADPDVFNGWRHAWAEPNDYRDKDIDVYRYTGNYEGKTRTIDILSHNGRVLGGYHFGEDETIEHATMINHNGYFSRLADDFKDAWDDLFNIRG